MADRKPTLDTKINSLTRLVEKGFAAVAHDIAHRPTNSSVSSIVQNVVRVELHERLSPLFDELKSIRKDLDELKEKVDNSAGLTKEIDHALSRITDMERYLDSQSPSWRRSS